MKFRHRAEAESAFLHAKSLSGYRLNFSWFQDSLKLQPKSGAADAAGADAAAAAASAVAVASD